MGPRAWLALTYAEVGRTDEARTEANELLKISPSFSAGGWLKFEGFIDAAEYEKRISALREIGLQE